MSGGEVGRLTVRAAAGSKDPPRDRGRRRVGPEHSTGPQLIKVGETDPGEFEKVGLGGADELGDELKEHEALEQLAAFSLLARWVDDSTVETAV
ncbi:hypothetical protein [Streptomyces sp. NPDC014006]|uniref:hypothetical protein n=1 Tax=Streptomyces sp. NPDC014006 TaxID=3364870 RepID=UPI0036FFED75